MATLLETFILRRAAIYATPGAPTDTLKRVYGDLTDGEDGVVPCTEIQKWNGVTQVFQIADGPIKNTAPTVYANNVVVGSGYTFSASSNFEARGAVAILTFTTDRTGQQISVKCKGHENADGVLIENPAEIVRDLLLTRHGLTWEWDATTYSQAYNDCAAAGLVGGGVVLDDGDPVTLADGVLKPIGGASVRGDGRLQLFVETLPAVAIPEEIYEAHECVCTVRRSIDAVVNDVQLEHRFNWRKRAFASLEKHFDGYATKSDAQSILEYGTRTKPLQAPWLRTTLAADAAVTTVLALRRRPRWDVTVEVTNFKAHLHTPGDVIAVTGRRQLPGGAAVGGPWDRRLLRVRNLSLGFERGGCTLAGYDLERNWFITAYPLDGTRRLDGSWRLGANAGTP